MGRVHVRRTQCHIHAMSRQPHIPAELTKRPFTLDEARAAGLSKRSLQGKAWKRIGSELYAWSGLHEDNWHLLAAWHRKLPQAVFTGVSAAWLHRLDVDPAHPVEVTLPRTSGVRTQVGLMVRRRDLQQSDVTRIRGLYATNAGRTFADLRWRIPEQELVVLADQALRLGLGRFHELAEPAESPMESRLRWLLIQSGLPRPEVQANLEFGRADLFYRSAGLVIEFDGGNHRDRLVQDNRRQNALTEAGYRILRYTASDVYQRPEHVISEVRRAVR